jgi:hypothetical protein
MRIVTWNCGMALVRKAPSLLALDLDIAVVQECSKKSVDDLRSYGFSGLWFGTNVNKGLKIGKDSTAHTTFCGQPQRETLCSSEPIFRSLFAPVVYHPL